MARVVPALIGGLGLATVSGAAGLDDMLCGVARHPHWLSRPCHMLNSHPLLSAIFATALIVLSLLLLWRWYRARQRVISYDSDAGRWIVLGWVLVAGGMVSLLAGLILVGSNGWPFSHQSRHIGIRTGQLPVFISAVQPRYFAGYAGADGLQSLCASFGAVTFENRSRFRSLTLELALLVTPHERRRETPHTAMPTRDDLTAIARRGLSADAVFRNPVALGPRQSLRRELVFVVRPATGGLSDADHDFALAVTDRGSGQTVSFALPAEYHG